MTTSSAPGKGRVLTLSTSAFTVMFAVWLVFGVLGIPIRKEFGLADVQLAWITSVAVLNAPSGACSRASRPTAGAVRSSCR